MWAQHMTNELAQRLIALQTEFQATLSQVRQERSTAHGNKKTVLRKVGNLLDGARPWIEDALELVE